MQTATVCAGTSEENVETESVPLYVLRARGSTSADHLALGATDRTSHHPAPLHHAHTQHTTTTPQPLHTEAPLKHHSSTAPPLKHH